MADSAALLAGRYRIVDRIGEGGLGVVYRVEDQAEGQIRALKVMPRASGRPNLRGEFLALARLQHDNIVRVHDYGLTSRGDDYFTMELVRGRDILSTAPPPTTAGFYPLVGGAVSALAFLHSRGIVHADVKPSNILVDEETLQHDPARAAKLLDFGLAAQTSDPAAAAARGTFPYAAPEVYAGRLDERSDLYALGVVLYELACGQRPFPGNDFVDVIRRQRKSAPPDPRTVRADVPPALAELILGLLEPEPGARFQTADEVLQRINEVSGTHFALAGAIPKVDLTGTLVGRERHLTEVLSLWAEARTRDGAAALVVGEAGVGKTRLLGELKLRIQLAGGRFYGASAAGAAGSDSPWPGLARLVRQVAIDHPTLLAERSPVLAPLLDSPLRADKSLDPAAERARDGESRFALAEALAGFFLDAAAVQPIVLALDDLDQAERGTVEIFGYLCRAVTAGRLLLVGAAEAAASQRIEELAAGSLPLHRLELAPLDRPSVAALVQAVFGAGIAEELAPDLHRASGGNPAILGRVLDDLVARGVVARRRGAWALAERQPEIPAAGDAVAAALRRASALPASARRVLEAAAVVGTRFDWRTLAALAALHGEAPAGPTDESISEALAAAIALRLVESDAQGGAFLFAHAGVRAALYEGIEGGQRERLHRAAAASLGARAAAGERVTAAALAEHWLAVGAPEGIGFALAAADEHLDAFDHHGALRWTQRAREAQGAAADPARAAALDERLGDLHAILGELEAATADYTRAQDGAADASVWARVARKHAEVLRRRGQGDSAIDLLMRGLDKARSGRATAEEAACHLAAARVRMFRAEYPVAVEHSEAGLVLARAAGDRDLQAMLEKTRADIETYRSDAKAALGHAEAVLANPLGVKALTLADVHMTRGRASIHAGDYARAIESLEHAIEVYRRVGRVEQEAKAMNNLGVACYYGGDWERARASWHEYAHLCERMGELQELVVALNNLSFIYRDRGELAEALAVLERARRQAEKIGRVHSLTRILGNRGDVLFRQGDVPGARDLWEQCLIEFKQLGAREDALETRRRLCEADLQAGQITVALDKALDAAREAKEIGAHLEEGILHRVAGTALRQQGDLDSAAWFLDRGRQILGGMGARYERARTDVEAAELALSRGERQKGSALLDEAIETFASLGARWDLGRARERKAALARPVAVTPSGWEVVLEVARASGTMELEQLLQILLDKILEVTAFERGFLLLLDERGRPTERMRRTRGQASQFDREQSEFSGSIVRRVAQTGEPTAVTDIGADEALRSQKSVIALGLRSVMCAPMRLRGRVIGIVYVDSRRLADADHRAQDLALLEALASQAAIVVENARLVAEEKRKSDLMAILAHEIRNPLAGILGYSELLPEERAALPGEAVGILERIHRDAQRLKRLVDNVLELARVEAGKVEWSMGPVPLPDLLRDVKASYDAMAQKKGLEILLEMDQQLPPALANADRLFQVLSNLVGNALKFTPKGGRIVLSARLEQHTPMPGGAHPSDDDLAAWVPFIEPQKSRTSLRVDVSDTGPGIPPDRQRQVFQKFGQADTKTSQGVGLGLYISQEIIKRHGGTIWVDSSLGKGTTFSFRLPVR